MGARTTATVEEALGEAAAVLGRAPRVLAVPELMRLLLDEHGLSDNSNTIQVVADTDRAADVAAVQQAA